MKTNIKLELNMNTRRMTKIIDMFIKHAESFSNDLKEMDEKGCPECGSYDYRIEDEINRDNKDFEGVICLECGHRYVRLDGKTELLNRK
jgi:predicted  nucleic acid-binding Zn-ribbon protein